jgi:hypothetical protein
LRRRQRADHEAVEPEKHHSPMVEVRMTSSGSFVSLPASSEGGMLLTLPMDNTSTN